MTKYVLIASVLALGAAPALAQTVGFKNGNAISVTTYHGDAELSCGAGKIPQLVICDQYVAVPGVDDVLVSSLPVDADHVVLVAKHTDGSQVTKNVAFDGKNGVSKRVNLLIHTLLQRPLLKMGANEVNYKFKKGSGVVMTGTFTVNVQSAGNLECPYLPIYGWAGQCTPVNEQMTCDQYYNQVTGCK